MWLGLEADENPPHAPISPLSNSTPTPAAPGRRGRGNAAAALRVFRSRSMRMRVSFLFFAAAAMAVPLAAQDVESKGPTHPREVALVDEGDKGYVYRKFPTGERLYTYDRDPQGRSTCNKGCTSAWPPVLAPPKSQPVGEWSIVRRADGKRQWALKGKPVYLRFHDTADVATGDGLEGLWHLVDYTRAPVNPKPE
jgi:predicted lipoprotein with Yx(FWY)xxD motif